MIFAAPLNWLWLIALGVIGATIRHFFNLKNAGVFRPGVLIVAALAFVAVAALNERVRQPPVATGAVPAYADIRALVDRHCSMCHAKVPTHAGITAPPNGAVFDSADALRRSRVIHRILEHRPIRVNRATYLPEQMQGWYEIVFRETKSGARRVFNLDDLVKLVIQREKRSARR